ncbi:MAG: outer membrane protein [Bacteroidia bacterium]|jgi:outer membrane protein
MKVFKVLLTGALFASMFSTSFGQVKIAHVNSAELIEMLPQVDSIEMRLLNLSQQYQYSLQAIEKELEDKRAYWKANPTKDLDITQLREEEFAEIQRRYQTKQQEANVKLQQKQEELLEPVIKDLKLKIEEVAKSKGYTYVFDSSDGGGLIYGDPAHDLMTAMKAKLNLQ